MAPDPADRAARSLLDSTAASLASTLARERWSGDLAGGAAGAALFLARYAVRAEDRKIAAVALALADAALGQAIRQQLAALHTGFLGAVWAATRIGELLGATICSPAVADRAAEIAVTSLDDELQADHFDLLEGVVGVGVFGLLAGGKRRRHIVRKAIGKLVDGAEITPRGITWQTPPERMLPEARRMFGAGYYNIGLAHGVPGIVAFLSAAATAGFEHDRLASSIRGGCAWLLAQAQASAASMFPHAVGLDGTPHSPSRLSWCYGDLSVAVALASAAHALGDEELRRRGALIASSAALRLDGRAGVDDNTLCHGASGVALIFRRLHDLLGRAELLAASRYWLRVSRALLERSAGRRPAIGMLQGSSGVGLVHLDIHALPSVEWTRVLLLP